MKKIAFTDFWDGFNPEKSPRTRYFLDACDYELTDLTHADYVIYSVHGNRHWQADDHCIKIFYTVENLVPDFNACDYAVGFEWMDYGDRYIRMPLYYVYPDINELAENRHLHSDTIKASKTDFCSITVSNTNRDPIFSTLFDALSAYKRVDSGGKWKNNVAGGQVSDKMAFDRSHKFSIVCENSEHPGYTTEKIVQAFAAGCIPIYWGDPEIARVFNPKSFVNVREFHTIDDVVRRVREIDTDARLYERILREPVLTDSIYSKARQEKLFRQFLSNIFEQPLEQAQRRNRVFHGRIYLDARRKQVSSLSFRCYQKFHDLVWKTKLAVRKILVDRGTL